MNPLDLYYECCNLVDGTQVADTAKAICYVRQVDPYNWTQTINGGLTQWQAIVYEARLRFNISGLYGL